MDDADAGRAAEHIAAQHEAVRTFIGKRSSAPGTGENVLNVKPYGHIKSLHVGRGRGATIYDANADVCWLLAYSPTHAVGERRDAFKYFERLDARGELLPSTEDYVGLESVTEADVIDTLREWSATLLQAARATPGTESCISFTLVNGDEAKVAVAVELVIEARESAEQGWMSFLLPYNVGINVEQLLDLVAGLIPEHVESDAVSFATDICGRPLDPAEVAVTWESYEAGA